MQQSVRLSPFLSFLCCFFLKKKKKKTAYFSVTMVLLHQLFAIVLLAERTLRQKRDQETEKLLDGHQDVHVQNMNHDLRTS